MKKLCLLFGLVVLLTTACEKVETVTPFEPQEDPLAEVIRIAQEGAAMLGDAETRSAVGRRIDRSRISCKINPATRAGESDDTLYYVVNYADNAGFAIVSANDDAPDGARLIAVTEAGCYTAGEETDNEGFNMYMDMVELADFRDDLIIDTTILKPKYSYYEDIVTYSPWYGVSPLVQVKWGQGNTPTYSYSFPYNKYCFDSDTNTLLCPAGCVAVAIAQIMSYHRKPASYMLTYDGSDRIIPLDWNALNSYVGGYGYSWTATAGDAIALWLREIGKRADMTYTPEGSGTSDSWARVCFATFGYDQLPIIDYNYATIQSELASGRPVYISGDRRISQNDGSLAYSGHAWVVDGYKTRTEYIDTYEVFPSPLGEEFDRRELRWQTSTTYQYVHYNWGVNGEYNGYFNDHIFQLNLESEVAGGYDNAINGSLDYSYHYNVAIITGIFNNNTY